MESFSKFAFSSQVLPFVSKAVKKKPQNCTSNNKRYQYTLKSWCHINSLPFLMIKYTNNKLDLYIFHQGKNGCFSKYSLQGAA